MASTTYDQLRGLVLSSVELRALHPDWSEAMIEDYLNIFNNFVTITELLDIEIDQKIEEVPTDFAEGSIPFTNATTGFLVEDNTNLVWDTVSEALKPKNIIVSTTTASLLLATNASNAVISVADLTSWIAGTANQVTVTDDADGTITLSTPQNTDTNADVEFDSITLDDLTALELVSTDASKKLISIADGAADEILTTDGAGAYEFKTLTVPAQLLEMSMYDPAPARSSESNWNGGLLILAAARPLDSVPTDVVVSKGIGKVVISVNAGSDLAGDITITGTSVDRNTGATTPADTDTITVDALTTDNSTTDANGNVVHEFIGAYISSKWFHGTVTLSTTNLTLTDVDVYHCSFEQVNDSPGLTLKTFDANLFTTNANAEFDAYLSVVHVTGDKCTIHQEASLHVGAIGLTALVDSYERLRRGNIDDTLDGTTDGFWVDIHYSNSPAYVEDVTLRVYFTIDRDITLA